MPTTITAYKVTTVDSIKTWGISDDYNVDCCDPAPCIQIPDTLLLITPQTGQTLDDLEEQMEADGRIALYEQLTLCEIRHGELELIDGVPAVDGVPLKRWLDVQAGDVAVYFDPQQN